MTIILGATGQIGSYIIEELRNQSEPIRGIVRSDKNAEKLSDIEVEVADFFDFEALKEAFSGGHTVFLLTPENPHSEDIISDTKIILNNYREAILYSGIKKVVGLSSIGAQHKTGTGNLGMSYMLEHALQDLPIEQIFIRPAYYYSNWLGYIETVKEQGILPTFFPISQKIPMVAPPDVAKFVTRIIMNEINKEKIYEVVGPAAYSSSEVADIFGELFNKKVEAQQIPQEQWKETLQQAGFTDNAADNLIKMTEAVINGKARPEKEDKDLIKLKTNLQDYLMKL